MKKTLVLITSAIILSIVTAMLSGCGGDSRTATDDTVATTANETHEVSSSVSEATTPTLSKEEQAIVDAGLKIDDKGNIVDKNGKKVETKDGKVEVKTADGKTVTVNATEVSNANDSNNKINTATEKNNSSTSSSSKSSSSSNKNSSNLKSETSKTSSSSSNTPKTPSNSSSSSSSSKVWHEAVYKTVNHPAETKKVWVVDKESYTYEEPVYEKQGRAICQKCGADITDNIDHIFDCNSSYRVDTVKVQVGTKTITVPEEGHWETKVIKEAWTEKVLVKEAGYY